MKRTVFTIALPDALDALADHPMARLESASFQPSPKGAPALRLKLRATAR